MPTTRRAALVLTAVVAAVATSTTAPAADNRLYMAAHYDWGGKKGFYLDFENSSQGGPCRLANLRLILGVADGTGWRFVSKTPAWKTGREYRARAEVAPASASFWLDGELIGTSPGGFAPAEARLQGNHVPAWARAQAEYHLVQTFLAVKTSGGRRIEKAFADDAARAPAVYLFEPQAGEELDAELPVSRGETVSVEVGFRIEMAPDVRALAPFIDRYGQPVHAEWPGKIRTDEDLARARAHEKRRNSAWGAPRGRDRFGGTKVRGFREEPTGFFRVTKRRGYWWLVSPEGNPCFYLGICSAPGLRWPQTPVTGREYLFEELPPRTGPFGETWGRDPWGGEPGVEYVAVHTANLIRKYGDDWQAKAKEVTRERLSAWGFSGIGKWGGQEETVRMPVLRLHGVPKITKHPDVFDPGVQAKLREKLASQIAPSRESPWVLGWSVGNEFEEIVTPDEVSKMLAMGAAVPAKRAIVEFGLDELHKGDVGSAARAWNVTAATREELSRTHPRPGADDLERMRRFYEGAYLKFLYRTVKEIDPNHLYFGFWIVPGWWVNEEDWRVAAPHCDVIGYDQYNDEFAGRGAARLIAETDKPVLCGEFSFPAWYRGRRGCGRYATWADDDRHSGELYERWVRAAASEAHCVGVMWFQYRDQPLTGRGRGSGPGLVYGEHYAFGMVDLADTPKWDLVERARRANLKAAEWRLEAMGR